MGQCVQYAPWLAQRAVQREVAERLYLASVCHPCVVVVKRLNRVLTEATYLEFLVLRFYLIYYHNASHARRDDYVRNEFHSGVVILAQVSAFIQEKLQCSSPGEALTWAIPTLFASDRYRTMRWSRVSPAHNGGVCPTVPGRDEYFLD